MQRPPNATDWSPVSRRQALAGIGTLATGATTVAVLGSDDARAQVTVDGLSVADGTFEANAITPKLIVDVAYRYDVTGADIDHVAFGLRVDDAELDSSALSTSSESLDETTQLGGRLTTLEQYTASAFDPAIGETVTVSFTATVTFAAVDSAGDDIVTASASDDATLTVAHPQDSEYQASVGGTGRIVDASAE